MGHTKASDLADLKAEFTEIRQLEGIKEKKPGIFYFKAISFLHFHDKDGVRWADVKTTHGWLEIKIDFNASPKAKADFVKCAKKAHLALLNQ